MNILKDLLPLLTNISLAYLMTEAGRACPVTLQEAKGQEAESERKTSSASLGEVCDAHADGRAANGGALYPN